MSDEMGRGGPVDYPPQVPKPIKWGTRARCIVPRRWTHVSTRTIEGRYAFTPADEVFTALVWGVIGVAQRRYGVDVAAFFMLGNHYHGLVRATRSGAVSSFMRYLNSQLVRLTHDYNGTRGRVWARRFSSTCLLDDEAERHWFQYIVSHSVKEGLCEDPRMWPGPQCVSALCGDDTLWAVRLDRRAWDDAGRPEDRRPFLDDVEVRLTPLSGFEGGPGERYREWCRARVADVVCRHAEERFVGVAVALSRGADYRPRTLKWSRCFSFDARGPEKTRLMAEAYAARDAGVEATAALSVRLIQAGHRAVVAAGDGLPPGFDWTPQIMDAIEDRPIVAPFGEGSVRPPGGARRV